MILKKFLFTNEPTYSTQRITKLEYMGINQPSFQAQWRDLLQVPGQLAAYQGLASCQWPKPQYLATLRAPFLGDYRKLAPWGAALVTR